MNCMQCKGEMEKKRVPYSVDRKGYHLYIREIPAMVCSQCGEKYFHSSVYESMEKLAASRAKPAARLTVDVVRFRMAV